MAQTLNAYWLSEIARIQGLIASAQAALQEAGLSQSAATADMTAAVRAVQDAQNRLDARRRDLAGIPMPGDGDPLLLLMRAALQDLRAAQAAQVAADTALRGAEADRAVAQARLDALNTALANASTESASANAAWQQRSGWANRVRAVPLRDLRTTATTALTTLLPQAKQHVEADFPSNVAPAKDFLTHVRARRAVVRADQLETDNVAAFAATRLKTWVESSTRKADLIPALAAAHATAVENLRRVAESGPRVQDAIATLQTLHGRATSFISTAERTALTATDIVNRENALAVLKTATDAHLAVFTSRTTYLEALFDLQVQHPDQTELTLRGDPALALLFADLQGKRDDLQTARLNLDGNAGQPLREWFAAVPEALWNAFEGLEAASDLLTAVQSGPAPVDVAAAWTTAEDALVAALKDRDLEAQQAAARIEGSTRQQLARAQAAEVAPARTRVAGRYVSLV